MKIPNSSREPASNGFTLPEILIAITVFLFVVAGIIAANLYGLRMFQTDQTKLNVSAWSRNIFGKMISEIHGCNSLMIGNFANGLTVPLNGEIQQGNALKIFPTSDTNSYVFYFINSSDQTFRRSTEQANSTVILAYSVTNTMAFSAQDFSGNTLTNSQNNEVIHLVLEMYQPGSFMRDADSYTLETSVKQRIEQ